MALSNSHTRDGLSKAGIIKSLSAAGIGAVVQWYKAAHTRRALADLTHDERRDIGCEEFGPNPVIEIEAGVMTRLMSMR